MKPPKRERRQRVLGIGTQYTSYGERWTLTEKQELLEGLKKHGPGNLDRIQKNYLPARHIDDIRNFISTIKIRYKDRKANNIVRKAPIETWLEEAAVLAKTEIKDHSFLLSEVFSVFGTVEPHDVLPHGHAPNWSEIYLYMAALLQGTPPTLPSPSNAMVLLSLIDSLVQDLRSLDATDQRKLMQCKYALLKQAKSASSKRLTYKWLRDALDEDPLEAKKKENGSSEQTSSSGQPVTSPEQPVTSSGPPGTSSEQPGTSSGQYSTLNTASNHMNDGASTSQTDIQCSASSPEAAPKSRGKAMFTINPFCIPVKYLKLTPTS